MAHSTAALTFRRITFGLMVLALGLGISTEANAQFNDTFSQGHMPPQETPPPEHHGSSGIGVGIGIGIINGIIRSVPRQPDCRLPAVYSPRLGRCIVPAAQRPICDPPFTFSRRLGRCVAPPPPKAPVRTISCKWPEVKSRGRCVCAAGFVSSRGQCVKPAPVIKVDIGHVQECLQKLGYDPGPIDGQTGRKTRSAFGDFQNDNGLGRNPDRLTDDATVNKLFELCDAAPEPGPEVATAPDSGPDKSDQRCLSKDLYDTLTAAYGARPGLEACTPTTEACLPKPAFYSDAKLASVAATNGINWCGACIKVGSWLPLDTVFRIEKAANVTLCATPPPLCYVPGPSSVKHQTAIRTIYRTLPRTVGHEGDIAVVIGNEDYAGGLPPHVNGHADADAVMQLLTEQLGFRKRNIIDLRDAKLVDLQRLFGSTINPKGELATRVADAKPENIFVYISSHGMTKEPDGDSYLLPVDADPENLGDTAYPLQELYANLGKTGARTTMLMLEGTFAETISDLVDPPNIPQLEVKAMPETPVPGLAVFTASDRDQHALEDPEYGIGLFTRYLIAGLAGEADVAPIGNGDKRVDSVELFVYTSDMVRTAARKSFGLEQKPLLSKIDNLVVGQLAAK